MLVAMSGGVDSSIGAALLAEAGWDVIGVTLKLWCYGESEDAATPRSCCSLDAIADARSVALAMNFPHHVLDESALFRDKVVAPFVRDYLAGETPYPCAQCNTHLKFGSLFAHATKAGADYLATGHYARIERAGADGEPALLRAAHADKDQTYALWGIARATLPRLAVTSRYGTLRSTVRRTCSTIAPPKFRSAITRSALNSREAATATRPHASGDNLQVRSART